MEISCRRGSDVNRWDRGKREERQLIWRNYRPRDVAWKGPLGVSSPKPNYHLHKVMPTYLWGLSWPLRDLFQGCITFLVKNLFLKPILKQWPLSFVILMFPSKAWLHHLHNSSSSCCRLAASLLTSFSWIWKSPASQASSLKPRKPQLPGHVGKPVLDPLWVINNPLEMGGPTLDNTSRFYKSLQCLPMPPGLLFSPDWKSKNKRKPCQAYKATPLTQVVEQTPFRDALRHRRQSTDKASSQGANH